MEENNRFSRAILEDTFEIVKESIDEELEVAFLKKNGRTIVFKGHEWEKVHFFNNFFVIETEKKIYMYNSSIIKSIKIV